VAAHKARQLQKESSAASDKIARRKRSHIVRNGKLPGIAQPANQILANAWKKIMAEVWAAQREASGTTPNPVLVERGRRCR